MNHSFIRFLLVGVVNTLVGLGTMYLLLDGFHLGYWISSFTGNSVGAVVSYFLNRRFTFNSHISIRKSGFRFIIAILVCYLVSFKLSQSLTYTLLVHGGHLSRHLADEIALLFGSGLYTISNYFAQKQFVFPKHREKLNMR